jgi:hypothetical protein
MHMTNYQDAVSILVKSRKINSVTSFKVKALNKFIMKKIIIRLVIFVFVLLAFTACMGGSHLAHSGSQTQNQSGGHSSHQSGASSSNSTGGCH